MDKYTPEWYANRLKNKQNSRSSPSGFYYWLFIENNPNATAFRFTCCGYETDESAAMQRAYDIANGKDFKIHESRSRDKNKAVAEFKGSLLGSGSTLDEALIRVKHKNGG